MNNKVSDLIRIADCLKTTQNPRIRQQLLEVFDLATQSVIKDLTPEDKTRKKTPPK